VWWPWWVALAGFVVATLSFVVLRADTVANWLTVAITVLVAIGMLRDRWERGSVGRTKGRR
jgi:hypothetical protein